MPPVFESEKYKNSEIKTVLDIDWQIAPLQAVALKLMEALFV